MNLNRETNLRSRTMNLVTNNYMLKNKCYYSTTNMLKNKCYYSTTNNNTNLKKPDFNFFCFYEKYNTYLPNNLLPSNNFLC